VYPTTKQPFALNATSHEEPLQLPSNTQLERQLFATVRTADVLLRQGIGVPDGHQWSVNDDLSNVMGGPLVAWNSGVWFCIRKKCAPNNDAAALGKDREVAVDICLFLPEQQYVRGQRVRTFGRGRGCRFGASLSVKSDVQFVSRCHDTDRLDEANCQLKAETLEGLVDAVAKIVNVALQPPQHLEARTQSRSYCETPQETSTA
jgi:hypothetical protein